MPQRVPNTPAEWDGSKPEWAVYWALTRLGYKEGVHFVYQSPQMGGRIYLGGAVLDFYFEGLGIAIEVQSAYYHYGDAQTRATDAMQKAQLLSYGIQVIYIDEQDALSNPVYFVKEALAGRDHSLIGG